MTTQPHDIAMQAWKQQMDGCRRTIDTLVEAATRLRALQLEAAANADAEKCAAALAQAYKQWLETAQQLYKLPAIPS